MSKTALLRFNSDDEKEEAVKAARKRHRSLNSYVMTLVHQDRQKLLVEEKQTNNQQVEGYRAEIAEEMSEAVAGHRR